MSYIKLENVLRTEDGISYLRANSPVFMDKFKEFLHVAGGFVNPFEFNMGMPDFQTDVVNFEYSYVGATKVILSFTSDVKDRDYDCQYKVFDKVEFSLDKDKNLVINEQSGRLESKYSYNFENTDGGFLKTSYSYQVFNPKGEEILHRGYIDQFDVDSRDFIRLERNLRDPIRGAFDPQLASFDGKKLLPHVKIKNPILTERVNEQGNVKVTSYYFGKNHIVNDKRENYVGNNKEGRTIR